MAMAADPHRREEELAQVLERHEKREKDLADYETKLSEVQDREGVLQKELEKIQKQLNELHQEQFDLKRYAKTLKLNKEMAQRDIAQDRARILQLEEVRHNAYLPKAVMVSESGRISPVGSLAYSESIDVSIGESVFSLTPASGSPNECPTIVVPLRAEPDFLHQDEKTRRSVGSFVMVDSACTEESSFATCSTVTEYSPVLRSTSNMSAIPENSTAELKGQLKVYCKEDREIEDHVTSESCSKANKETVPESRDDLEAEGVSGSQESSPKSRLSAPGSQESTPSTLSRASVTSAGPLPLPCSGQGSELVPRLTPKEIEDLLERTAVVISGLRIPSSRDGQEALRKLLADFSKCILRSADSSGVVVVEQVTFTHPILRRRSSRYANHCWIMLCDVVGGDPAGWFLNQAGAGEHLSERLVSFATANSSQCGYPDFAESTIAGMPGMINAIDGARGQRMSEAGLQ